MPDIATVNNIVQIGVEATPGTSVAATKLLQALSIEPAIKADIKTFRPMGGKFATVAALGKESVEAKLSGQATYTEIVYPLASAFAYAAPVQISPPSGLAYRWTFTPSQSQTDTIKTYTVEHGSSVRARKWTYGLVTEFGYKLTRDEFTIDGTMLGQALQDGISLTASPTAVPLVPILPTQVNVYLDSTSAGIGTTQLLRVLSAEFKMSDRFGPVWPLNSAISGFAAHVETAPKAELKLLVEADAQGMELLTAMRTGDKKYIRITATGPNIETGNDYSFQHDLCGVVSDVSDFSDEDGVYAIEWTFTVAYDAAWGMAQQIQVVNTLSTL
ncbi:MAG: hypothetical protein IRY83_04105 [Chloroflexi bacterium]|nr:hypothetical protein [Chloroflexota bacterium]